MHAGMLTIMCVYVCVYKNQSDVMAKVQDCEFELKSRYYVHFRTNTRRKLMIRLILQPQ